MTRTFLSSDNLGFILEKLLINMVICNISGAEVALLGRAVNFVALSVRGQRPESLLQSLWSAWSPKTSANRPSAAGAAHRERHGSVRFELDPAHRAVQL